MHANQENAVRGAPTAQLELAPATLNEFGDVVCPHCRVNIITPAGYKLVCGVAACLRCRQSFEVSEAIAEEAETIYRTRVLRRQANVKAN